MNIASLFELAGPDLLIILVIVLFLVGVKKLPELAKGMSEAIRQFIEAKDEFEHEMTRRKDSPAKARRSWKFLLVRVHRGFAAAAMAPFPLSR